jgi:hypothetical protein
VKQLTYNTFEITSTGSAVDLRDEDQVVIPTTTAGNILTLTDYATCNEARPRILVIPLPLLNSRLSFDSRWRQTEAVFAWRRKRRLTAVE